MGITNFLYNPEHKGKHQLIGEFVVRREIFDLIRKDLLTSPMKTPEQHYLLVGQRGTGKTTLLHRIRYAIEDEPALKDWLIPVILSEEQYNISELANLWENIGQVLEDYYGFEGLYGTMVANITSENFGERCWDLLETALNEKGKKVVLLLDNIGDLLRKLSDLEIRRLRMILQIKPHLRLIAASPLYLESILDYKQPLFEFFKVLRLESLSSSETHALLLQLANVHNEQEKIDKILRETPERVETLRTLTGGVPRTIALMFNIFIEHKQENSLRDLERILDIVTPLYKHRMDDLPAQQQKIVDAVAKAWDPIGVKLLKERVRLQGKVISAQLRQLEKNQVVQKLETGTKNHEYILKERFFNIWYLMRYGRRDDKQKVIWLVRFLESWCTKEDLRKRVTEFIELVKHKGDNFRSLELFAQVYTSISILETELKLLLDENLPEYRSNIQYSSEELNRVIDKKFNETDYSECIRLIGLKKEITDKDRRTIWKIVESSIDGSDPDKQLKMFRAVLKNSFETRKLTVAMIQVSLYALILYTEFMIITDIHADQLEEAIDKCKYQLESVAGILVVLDNVLIFEKFGFELKTLLIGIKMLIGNGQFYAVQKFFYGEVGDKNNKVKLSEIFNPIYLAINSLDPDGSAVNISPEKVEIVQQIRDFITKE